MKRIKNIYKSACVFGLLAIGTTSCEDWLTIYPTNKVVEENYWEDKNDLDAVRYGAYKQMANTVGKLAVWGDLRADTYKMNPQVDDDNDDYNEILKGMLDSTMTVFEWNGLYTTINYCNKVLQHGPEVLAKDKQFTNTEWNYIHAEMVALRSLNYFYLIRAFKDVPFTKKVVNTDAEVEPMPQSMQLDVLDSIIVDCESVMGQARNRFTSNSDTKGLITNTAIYAMLADMYLWRASLREGRFGREAVDNLSTPRCILADGRTKHTPNIDYKIAAAYADKALEALEQQTIEAQGAQFNTSRLKTLNYGIPHCNMIVNDFIGVTQNITPALEAHRSIFNSGNSVESIFELQFNTGDNRKNDVVNKLFGFNRDTQLCVSDEAIKICYTGGPEKNQDYDTRTWTSAVTKIKSGTTTDAQQNPYCLKYATPVVTLKDGTSERELDYVTPTNSSYRNWIIYRMTDVMLIRAEALACYSEDKTELGEVNAICSAIRRRAYCNLKEASKNPSETAQDAFTKIDYCTPIPNVTTGNKNDRDKYIRMVMNERQIELLGEGKRWFDLVRWAERKAGQQAGEPDPVESTEETPIGNGLEGVTKMLKEFYEASNPQWVGTLTTRFKNRYGLYCPIYYKEVTASNGVLRQNPVWNRSKYQQ